MSNGRELGEEFVNEFIKQHGSETIEHLNEVLPDVASVEYVSDTWKSRPKANMVKWLMSKSGTSLDTIAEYLGCSRQYLNNKLFRDSFSFDDLVIVAFACGYSFTLTSNDDDIAHRSIYRVDVADFFQNSDKDVLARIRRLENKKYDELYARLVEIQKELEKMTKDFDVDDIMYALIKNGKK